MLLNIVASIGIASLDIDKILGVTSSRASAVGICGGCGDVVGGSGGDIVGASGVVVTTNEFSGLTVDELALGHQLI